jgi:excisionase family DNA binding protein
MSICATRVSKEAQNELKGLRPLTVTLKTARQLLGIGNTKLYQLINDGTIETITVGRRRLAV